MRLGEARVTLALALGIGVLGVALEQRWFDPACCTLVPARVLEGELHRALTANLLHVDRGTLLYNLALLLVFGAALERIIGWRRFASLLLVAGAGGCLLTVYVFHRFAPEISFRGASILVLAVLVAYGSVRLRFRHVLPRGALFPWVYLPVMALCLDEVVPHSSPAWVAHLLGALLGFAVPLAWSDPSHRSTANSTPSGR